ncbi:MAG: WecB/TagA/CpsF family glycosyltransferase [Asticcacaulis sp.]
MRAWRAQKGPARLIFDSNGHAISLASTDPKFKSLIDSADVVHADGGFVVTASRLFARAPIVERSATTDMIHDLAAESEASGFRFFLLGGTEEVNADCAARLKELYPGLNICGRRNGYFKPDEEAEVIDLINDSNADVVWVGLGKPKEQCFCIDNRKMVNAAWLITCGGCFNYITGHYKRAPRWMQKYNLEWLHRMVTNPKNLFWRYFVTTPHALLLCLLKTK